MTFNFHPLSIFHFPGGVGRRASWKRFFQSLLSLGIVFAMIGFSFSCSGPEEKKNRFFTNGKRLYESGDYARANVEMKNVLQIDANDTEALYLLGMCALKQSDFKKAYNAFLNCVTLDPNHVGARLELGKIYLASRSLDKAREEIDKILQLEPENQSCLLLKSAVHLAKKEPDAALTLLESLQRKGNTDSTLYQMMFVAYHEKKEDGKAESIIKKGIETYPDSNILKKTLVLFYLQRNRMADAVTLQSQIASQNPGQLIHTYDLAMIYFRMEQPEKANNLIQRMLVAPSNPEDAHAMAASYYMATKQAEARERTLKKGVAEVPQSYRLHLMLSDFYAEGGNRGQAIDTLTRALSLESPKGAPEEIDVKIALANLYFLENDLETAITLVDEVVKESPVNIRGQFLKGKILYMKGDGMGAVSCFRTVIAERSTAMEAYLLLADAHLLNQENALALETLKTAKKIFPKEKSVLRALARLHAANKEVEEVRASLEEIVAVDAKDSQSMADLGDFYLSQKRFREAEKEFMAIKTDAPKTPIGYLRLSHLYMTEKNTKNAIAVLEEGAQFMPDSELLWSSLAKVYLMDNQWDAALDICEKRLALNSADPFAVNLMGELYAFKKNFEKAEALFNQVISLNPKWQTPYSNLAKLLMKGGKTEKAISTLETMISKEPPNVPAGMTLATIYTTTAAYDGAIRVYETVLRHDPTIWVAANNLAVILSDHGDTAVQTMKRALEWAEKAARLNPGEPLITDTLGWIHYKLGHMDQAALYSRKALLAHPENPMFNYHMGMVLYRQGNHNEAITKLEKAVSDGAPFDGKEEAERVLQELRP